MKRTLVTILAFLYLLVVSGVSVSLHYCMGNLASVEYGIPEDHSCSKCGMTEKKGCCHTESKFVKIQDEHQWAKANISFEAAPAEILSESFYTLPVYSEKSSIELQYHSPPDPRVNEVYLHNSVFRI